jgi:hypothetical protein
LRINKNIQIDQPKIISIFVAVDARQALPRPRAGKERDAARLSRTDV